MRSLEPAESINEQEINKNDMYFHTYNQTEYTRFLQKTMTQHFLVEHVIHFVFFVFF